MFDSISNAISRNLQYQLRSQHFQLFDGYPCGSIQLTIEKLRSLKVVGTAGNSDLKPNDVTSRLRDLGLNEARLEETLNIEIIGNYVSFLKRLKTQNFNIGQRNHGALKLEGFSRYEFELESIFKFLLVFSFQGSLLDAIWMYDAMQHVGPICSSPKEKLPNIDGVCVVGGDSHSSP
jgi:hypothetical protein